MGISSREWMTELAGSGVDLDQAGSHIFKYDNI
jgi:hypothetical protein